MKTEKILGDPKQTVLLGVEGGSHGAETFLGMLGLPEGLHRAVKNHVCRLKYNIYVKKLGYEA